MKIKYILVDAVPEKCDSCPFNGKKTNKCKLNKDKYGVSNLSCPLMTEEGYNSSSSQ